MNMTIKVLFIDFIILFVIALIVASMVTLLWNRVVYGAGAVDWAASFRFALIFGLVLTWIEMRRRKGVDYGNHESRRLH